MPDSINFAGNLHWMKLNFCSLSSGSSGNCYYIGNEFHGILIDAGISATSIRRFLKEIDVSMQTIMGVFISHNHSDHIRGLEVLTRRNHIPVFTTGNIWRSILTPHSRISRDCIREIPVQQPFDIAEFRLEAFPVCHDAPETVGFMITHEDKRIAVVTDLGHICETSAGYIRQANLLVIESNYDEQMLLTGGYPWYLKKRIQSDHGHLGNHQASGFLSEMLSESLSHICLAHLSKNNNTPEKALETLASTFHAKGIDPNGRKITVLKRNQPTDMIII